VRLALDHCVIAVSHWDRSNAFYRDVLGAEIVQRDETFAHYVFGEWHLNVHGPSFEGLNARLPVQPGSSDLCLIWPGTFETAIEHLEQHGVPVEAGPIGHDGPRGKGTSVYFRDPDGSLLELLSYGSSSSSDPRT
jgi:catechol 2,3-dioxygenase-like lactoylglutathione lyase family enzyme